MPTTDTDSLQLRIQHGGDYQVFSDGLIILVDDAGEVRGDPTSNGTPRPSLLGQPLVVALPAGVTTPDVPLTPKGLQSIVHANLYLDATCRTQNDALYALAAVTTNPDGSCSQPDGGDPPLSCDGASVTGAVRTSTIVFNALFDGNSAESNTADLLSDGTFHLFLADPREICPGGMGPPPRCRGGHGQLPLLFPARAARAAVSLAGMTDAHLAYIARQGPTPSRRHRLARPDLHR